MKENINLGDKSKFVSYGTNGVKNCLDLCKMILKKYGLSNFGSSANIFRLMYEKNDKLDYMEAIQKKTISRLLIVSIDIWKMVDQ